MLTNIPLIPSNPYIKTITLSTQQQIIQQLFLSPIIATRMMLIGNKEDWLIFQVLVPLECPTNAMNPSPFIQINISLHFTIFYPNKMPGLFLYNPILPWQCQFINLLGMEQGVNCSLQDFLIRLIQEIDQIGFKSWSKTVYQISYFSNEFISEQRGDQIPDKKNPNIADANLDLIFGQSGQFFHQLNEQNIKRQKQNLTVKCQEIIKSEIQFSLELNHEKDSYQLRKQKKQNDKTTAFELLDVDKQVKKEFSSQERFQNLEKGLLTRFSSLRSITQKKQGINQEKELSKFHQSSDKKKAEKNEKVGKNIERIKNGRKNLKPMNKNANLPKFLIRIFTKYVDRYKAQYPKKQYDRLMKECRKMKQIKKNQQRQNAFGLKHLKVFFYNRIEGCPNPKLNCRVISKIINNNLLTEIIHSQIPKSHRVCYLVACKIYALRCRNLNLASRIQTK